jgi:hypothetical protein
MQIEIHTAELLVPDSSPFEVETAIATLKSYKSPGIDQIPAQLIQPGGETHVLGSINSISNGRSRLFYQFRRREDLNSIRRNIIGDKLSESRRIR